uniref:Uncharacterized protein n=1 Tax=Sphaerodactylus townsendi TaxID=933632 RepID=A0ACB8FQ28_9SAUR
MFRALSVASLSHAPDLILLWLFRSGDPREEQSAVADPDRTGPCARAAPLPGIGIRSVGSILGVAGPGRKFAGNLLSGSGGPPLLGLAASGVLGPASLPAGRLRAGRLRRPAALLLGRRGVSIGARTEGGGESLRRGLELLRRRELCGPGPGLRRRGGRRRARPVGRGLASARRRLQPRTPGPSAWEPPALAPRTEQALPGRDAGRHHWRAGLSPAADAGPSPMDGQKARLEKGGVFKGGRSGEGIKGE